MAVQAPGFYALGLQRCNCFWMKNLGTKERKLHCFFVRHIVYKDSVLYNTRICSKYAVNISPELYTFYAQAGTDNCSRKVRTVVPISLPASLALFILAIAEAMEQNTMGTTTQNMRFVNMVPRGSRAVAPGHANPTMIPATMPRIMVSRNQLFFRNFIGNTAFIINVSIIKTGYCKVNCILCLKYCI